MAVHAARLLVLSAALICLLGAQHCDGAAARSRDTTWTRSGKSRLRGGNVCTLQHSEEVSGPRLMIICMRLTIESLNRILKRSLACTEAVPILFSGSHDDQKSKHRGTQPERGKAATAEHISAFVPEHVGP